MADEYTAELARMLGRAPAPVESTSKFGAKLHPRTEGRLNRYLPVIDKYARENNLDPELVKAVIRQESQGRIGAKSSTGVRGLMQVTKNTFEAFGPTGARRSDPEASIAAGTAYLGHLVSKYSGDMVKALAHYNSGGAAGRNPLRARKQGQDYVQKILNIDLKKDYAPGKFVNEGYPQPAEPQVYAPEQPLAAATDYVPDPFGLAAAEPTALL